MQFDYTPANRQQRFWDQVRFTDGCWLWMGYLTMDGYGRAWLHQRKEYVHRIAYIFEVGLIPEAMQVDHLCRIKACVRPDHLEVVSHRENVLRSQNWVATNLAKTHCPRGHAYAGDNLIYEWNGHGPHRKCRACRVARAKTASSREYQRAYRERQRQSAA